MSNYIGIDPGLSGALALLDENGRFLEIVDLPIKLKYLDKKDRVVKHCIDAKKLEEILSALIAENGNIDSVYLEDVHGRGGWSASISFGLGETIGSLLAVLDCMQLNVVWITPTFWKKYFKVTSDKESTRAKAISLYPGALNYLNRKKDHNRAESLLIARYAVEITRGPLK